MVATESRSQPTPATPKPSLGGKQRARVTRPGVILAERLARAAITLGGVGTIVAVSSIFLFLLYVVFPLLTGPTHEGQRVVPAIHQPGIGPQVRLGEDLHQAWSWLQDGRIQVIETTHGETVATRTPLADAPSTVSSTAFSPQGPVLIGYEDGRVALLDVDFAESFWSPKDAPEDLPRDIESEAVPFRDGVLVVTGADQYRYTRLETELSEALRTGSESSVRLCDLSNAPVGRVIATVHEDGAMRLLHVRETHNLMTDEIALKVKRYDLTVELSRPIDEAKHVLVSGLGLDIYLVWADGHLTHLDVRDPKDPKVLGELDLIEDGQGSLTTIGFLNGKTTLVYGDDRGRVRSLFNVLGSGALEYDADGKLVEQEDAASAVKRLVLAQSFDGPTEAAVTGFSPSVRSRLLAVAYQDGTAALFQSTSGERLLTFEGDRPLAAIAIGPKDDALVGRTEDAFAIWSFDPGFPEASLAGLFRPVWYEGYAKPEHVWQSTSASDDFEPKLGMLPLVFGTLKATLYSMLFGAPLAILAAIFTSEFLAVRLRTSVKATVELMASLPSVVLGFMAGLVIAPFVQDWLASVLVSLMTVPLALIVGAHLWQLLPAPLAVKYSGWQRFVSIALCIPVGLLGAMLGGGPMESVLFAGDTEAWLDGQIGSAFGGWFFLLLPVSALICAIASGLSRNSFLAKRATSTRTAIARSCLLRLVLGLVATTAISAVLSIALQGLGFDPRGTVVDTYVQRNAMIVGFAMGFAIIPIIYTLAEDALSEVPSALREGSLGAGATQWQTATRIVIPFAMSGLFSALMIGLGRAVGETMIVLMAAGNTPIMRWNAFDGFRTLSANIAVELPEAVRGDGHYRTLFLAATVLFGMTFILNTFAELVRRHFRKRTHAL